MAAKINVDVGANAASFGAFYEVFTQFEKAAKSMPDVWKQASNESKEMREQFRASSDHVRAMADQVDDMLDAVEKLDAASRSTSKAWGDMAKSSMKLAGGIKDATVSLLKWVGITSVVGGLLGGGGLFGLDRLANGVANTRQASMGVGSSFGSYNAFNVNYGRLGDPEGLLGRISFATHDVTGRRGLAGLGLSEDDMKGDTSDVAAKAIDRLGDLVDKIPDNVLGNTLEARGLSETFGLDFALRLKKTPKGERQAMARDYGRDKKRLDLDKETQREWQEFSTQMKRAKESFQNILTKALVGLEPGLNKLSDAFTSLLEVALKENGPVSHWIDELAHGVEWLAEHVDDDSFRKQVNDILVWIEALGKGMLFVGKKIVEFGAFFGVSSAEAAPASHATITADQRNGLSSLGSGGTPAQGGGGGNFERGGGRRGFMQRSGPAASGSGKLDEAIPDPHAPDMAAHEKHIIEYAKSIGIDPRVALTVAHKEGLNKLGMSRWGAGADHGLSHGAYQLYSGGGLGNRYKAETGRDPYDERNAFDMEEWALRYAKRHGWNDWHGATRNGIRGFMGIDRSHPDAPAREPKAQKISRIIINRNVGGDPSTQAAHMVAPA